VTLRHGDGIVYAKEVSLHTKPDTLWFLL